MPDYITPPLVTAPAELADEAFASLEAQVPGWLPSPGNLETWIVEALAQMAGELMYVASAVPASIFRYFGSSLLNLPPLDAVPATASSTWTVADDAGYTIPEGTLVGIAGPGGDLLAFGVQSEVEIESPDTTATDVILVAQDVGPAANGLTGDPSLIDALDFVTAVTLDGTTGGGTESETDAAYLSRLRGLLQLLAPRPILPGDFATLARQVPGVARATPIDLYNAELEEDGFPRCVTVVVADADGQPVAEDVREAAQALLDARREVNFLAFVIDPEYTDVDVVFTFHAYPDFDGDLVAAAAEAAVRTYLDPANFGAVPYGETPLWLLDDKVRYLEVAEQINRVEGLWYIDTLTLNGGTTDVALAGRGGLPQPGDVIGTVTPDEIIV